MPAKTIYVLGAGFSAAAGIPTQGALLGKVLDQQCGEELREFIMRVFGLDSDNARNLALEDVYTAIHKAVSRNQTIKGYCSEKLRMLEMDLSENISQAINIQTVSAVTRYLDVFVQRLGSPSQQCGVISLNWDILLDRRLIKHRRGEPRNYIDYGTNCTGLGNKNDRVKPALLAKRDSEHVVPLLKLHGSLNWLLCPQCERLYVDWDRKIGLERHSCRSCRPLAVFLQPSIILPTFQKTLDTLHYRQIWNRAALELSEAKKVVFLGYSFPLADFDFRALITKHLPTRAKIEVVLRGGDDQSGTGKRFQDYFGPRRCTVRYDGVVDYVNSLAADKTPTP